MSCATWTGEPGVYGGQVDEAGEVLGCAAPGALEQAQACPIELFVFIWICIWRHCICIWSWGLGPFKGLARIGFTNRLRPGAVRWGRVCLFKHGKQGRGGIDNLGDRSRVQGQSLGTQEPLLELSVETLSTVSKKLNGQ